MAAAAIDDDFAYDVEQLVWQDLDQRTRGRGWLHHFDKKPDRKSRRACKSSAFHSRGLQFHWGRNNYRRRKGRGGSAVYYKVGQPKSNISDRHRQHSILICMSYRNRYARLAGQQAGGAAVKAGIAAKKEAYIALQVVLQVVGWLFASGISCS